MSRLLVMEDETILARNIVQTLERSNFDVALAPTAHAARSLLSQHEFDLVLADITLSDGNGLEVLAESRAQLKNTPIVVMTGQDSLSNRVQAEAINVSAFLAKPFTLARLRELAGALVSQSVRTSGDAQRELRVAMYSHDTIGLGHMRRNSAIARELVALVPGISVLMLVGCPAGMIFDPQPGIDYVKLPSLAKLTRTVWQPSTLRTDPETTRSLRMGILERVLDTFAPDALVVDHEPAGVWDELVPSLTALSQRGKTQVILGLRDILDDPEQVARKWSDRDTAGVIQKYYNQIFVYGNPEFYPSAEAYGLERLKPGGVSYCGIATSTSPVPPHKGRRTPRRVLVGGGGGRDAYPLIEAAISAIKLIPQRKRPEMTVVAGPLMDEELRLDLAAKAVAAKVEFLASTDDFPALLRETDLFISMAGYNSVNECLALGCASIVVPRVGPSSEQRLRAARLAELGLARVLQFEDLDHNLLARMIRSPVATSDGISSLSFSGARIAARQIAARLDGQSPEIHSDTKGLAHAN